MGLYVIHISFMWYTYKTELSFCVLITSLRGEEESNNEKKKWLQGVKYQEQSIISLSGKKATTCGPHICMAIGIRIPGFQFATR